LGTTSELARLGSSINASPPVSVKCSVKGYPLFLWRLLLALILFGDESRQI
jgi:hypothetical protein